jgi:8-oxo-dGTP pyrophosphatase MutT (NUDIX family)
MAEGKKEFAGVILLTNDGRFILQLRDDKPGIVDPGKLSIFAGRVEAGEDMLTAARRELFEETTLRDVPLEFFQSFEKDPARHGAPGICHIYVAKDIDPAMVDVHEGQGYRLRSIDEISEEDTALIAYDILTAFAAS